METRVSETIIDIPVEKKNNCRICLEDNFEAEEMFSVALCGHQFCVECFKRYIEVGLLEGSALRCPLYKCESKLIFTSCANLLTPKLQEMWERRIEEESIPVTERIYCPNPNCSVLMSKTELSKSNGVESSCVKCGELFCVNCKVPWHKNLSCDNYKRLADDVNFQDLANANMWRRCGNCQHMIELSEGCIHIDCRCGYSFCYTCGAEWKEGGCRHRQKMNVLLWSVGICTFICFILFIFFIVSVPILIYHFRKSIFR